MDDMGKGQVMAINTWRLPEELGGGVVNPVDALSPELATLRKVKVPGTEWTIYVPALCLVPMVPEEPPVKSVVLCLRAPRWEIFKRCDGSNRGWVNPEDMTVHPWRHLHETWDQVHVLLWWDADHADEGIAVSAGRQSATSLVVSATIDDEPGVASVRIADGLAKYAYLGERDTFGVAAALLGLAMKERM